tara:strand:- start:3022 stop:4548 length:1527 start_codon:yes stop_codon:yes gene_type:complete
MSQSAFRHSVFSPHFTALICVAFACVVSMASAQPAIRAFLVFCDGYPGNYGGINTSVSTDGFIVRSLLEDNISEQGWGVSLEITEVSGESATADNVMRRFDAFSQQVGPEDTVFVHFSGHGVIKDQDTKEQFLQFCDLEMRSRKVWAEKIEALPVQLKILITDCCSSYPVKELAEGPEEINPWNSFYYLFRLHEGFVNITAASPGQDAYGTERGGFLTVNLASDMQRYKTWEQVFQRTETRVFDESSAEIRGLGDPSLQPQRPLAYGLGSLMFDRGNPDETVPERVKFILPDSNQRTIPEGELWEKGLYQLYFARNEIFARHGYDFSTPLLNYYFGDRFWYDRKPGFKSPNLSEVEIANVAAIRSIEKDKGGPFVPEERDLFIIGMTLEENRAYYDELYPDDSSSGTSNSPSGMAGPPDLLPYSSNEIVSRVAVQNLSLRNLSIARNEIFARHGYPFKGESLRQHFERKPYYQRKASATDPALSTIEEQNLWLIRKIERLKGGPYQWD